MQVGEAMLYRLAVGLFLKDQTGAGLRSLDKSAGAAEKRIAAVQKELDRLNKSAGASPKNALEAQRRVLALQRQEATVRAKLATASRSQEQNLYRSRLTALSMLRAEAATQQRQFAFEEKAGRAAVSRQQLLARQQFRERQEKLRGIEKEANEQKRADEALAARRLRIGLQAQRRADNYAAAETRRAALRDRVAQRQAIQQQRAGQRDHRSTGHAAGAAVQTGAHRAGIGGLAILGGLGYAVEKAAQFDQTTLETQLALTGGAPMDQAKRRAQMKSLQAAAFQASKSTGFFTAQEIMEGMKAAASSGAMFFGSDEFLKSTPTLARYIDIVGRLKNESPDMAAKQYVQLSHMAQKYSAAEQVPVANAAAMFSLLQPNTMEQGVTALGQMMPVLDSLGKGNYQEAFAMAAAADQGGVGAGRVGARLKDYVLAFTTHQSKQRELAKGRLHLGDAIDSDGRLSIDKSLQVIARAQEDYLKQYGVKKGTSRFNTDLAKALGIESLPIAAFLMTQRGRDLYSGDKHIIQKAAGGDYLTPMQDLLRDTPQGQQQQVKTKFDNEVIRFGTTGIPLLIKFLKQADDQLDRLDRFQKNHPRIFDWMLNAGIDLVALSAAVNVIGGGVAFAKGTYAVGKWGRTLLSAGAAAEESAGGVTAATTALKGLSLIEFAGIAGGISLVAAVLGSSFAAIPEGNRRSQNGTNATERQQYAGMKRYNARGELDPNGQYNVYGAKMDAASIAKWNQYNPHGKAYPAAGLTPGHMFNQPNFLPKPANHDDHSVRINMGGVQIMVPKGTTAQQAEVLIDELHRRLSSAVNAHGDQPISLLDPLPTRPSVGGMAFNQ